MAQLDYPIRPNAKGGFDILLKPTITAPAVSETATPPDMVDAQASMVEPENAGSQGAWVDQVMDTANSGLNATVGASGARAQYTPPPMPPDMGGGPLGKMLPAGMSDTLAGVAGGMDTIKREQSPLAGFAAGMAGAMTTRENRRESKRKEMLELEDRQYQRSRNAFMDKFLINRDTREGAAAEREGKSAERDEALDAMSAKVKGLEIQKAKIELDRLATQQGFTVEQSQKAMDQAARLTEAEYKEVTIDTPELKAEFQASLQRNLRTALQAAGGGVQGNAGAAASSGTGTSVDDPLQWTPATAPKTEAEAKAALDAAVAANGGQPITYIHPLTGKPKLYRGGAGAAM